MQDSYKIKQKLVNRKKNLYSYFDFLAFGGSKEEEIPSDFLFSFSKVLVISSAVLFSTLVIDGVNFGFSEVLKLLLAFFD